MFTGEYAQIYDLFHAKKDYRSEINQIISVLDFEEISGLTGFDFGCGTGVHASEFFNCGVKVDGYDISQDMLLVARHKYPNLIFSNNLDDLGSNYDFTYSLFDVISYQTTTEAAMNLIKSLYLKTRPGGYSLVDSWNSNGVRIDPPKLNEREVTWNSKGIKRKVIPDLSQADSDIYKLSIDLLETESKKILKAETHVLRAWSPEQVLEMMDRVGFKEMRLYNPSNPDLEFNPSDWRFGVKAKK